MKRFSKILTIFLSLLLALSLVAGCNGAANETTTAAETTIVDETTTAEETSDETDPGNQWGLQKFDPPVTIRVGAVVPADIQFRSGESIEDNVHTRWLEENLGIIQETMWSVGAADNAYETKLRLDMASGQPLPDVFRVRDKQLLADLVDSGLLAVTNEPMETYATDRTMSIFDGYDEAFNAIRRGDDILGIPRLSSMTGGTVLWIRDDWMANVGKSAPSDIFELEDLMEAFINEDPNMSGADDTIALSVSMRDGGRSGTGAVDWIFGMYGKYFPSDWAEADDGSLVYGGVQPTLKPALEKMAEWMEKGYLDREAAVLDGTQSAEAFMTGRSGIWAGPYWVVNGWINAIWEHNADAEIRAYELPAGPDGQINRRNPGVTSDWTVFYKDFDEWEAFFTYYDLLLNRPLADGTPETDPFYYGWAEGFDYVIDDDGTALTHQDDVPGGFILVKQYFSMIGHDDLNVPGMYDEPLQRFYDDIDAEIRNPRDSWVAGWHPLQIEAGVVRLNQQHFGHPDMFVGAPTPSMRSYWERLETLEIETYAKIMQGEQSVDSFDAFVTQWENQGGTEVTAEVNEWWDEVMGR